MTFRILFCLVVLLANVAVSHAVPLNSMLVPNRHVEDVEDGADAVLTALTADGVDATAIKTLKLIMRGDGLPSSITIPIHYEKTGYRETAKWHKNHMDGTIWLDASGYFDQYSESIQQRFISDPMRMYIKGINQIIKKVSSLPSSLTSSKGKKIADSFSRIGLFCHNVHTADLNEVYGIYLGFVIDASKIDHRNIHKYEAGLCILFDSRDGSRTEPKIYIIKPARFLCSEDSTALTIVQEAKISTVTARRIALAAHANALRHLGVDPLPEHTEEEEEEEEEEEAAEELLPDDGDPTSALIHVAPAGHRQLVTYKNAAPEELLERVLATSREMQARRAKLEELKRRTYSPEKKELRRAQNIINREIRSTRASRDAYAAVLQLQQENQLRAPKETPLAAGASSAARKSRTPASARSLRTSGVGSPAVSRIASPTHRETGYATTMTKHLAELKTAAVRASKAVDAYTLSKAADSSGHSQYSAGAAGAGAASADDRTHMATMERAQRAREKEEKEILSQERLARELVRQADAARRSREERAAAIAAQAALEREEAAAPAVAARAALASARPMPVDVAAARPAPARAADERRRGEEAAAQAAAIADALSPSPRYQRITGSLSPTGSATARDAGARRSPVGSDLISPTRLSGSLSAHTSPVRAETRATTPGAL